MKTVAGLAIVGAAAWILYDYYLANAGQLVALMTPGGTSQNVPIPAAYPPNPVLTNTAALAAMGS